MLKLKNIVNKKKLKKMGALALMSIFLVGNLNVGIVFASPHPSPLPKVEGDRTESKILEEKAIEKLDKIENILDKAVINIDNKLETNIKKLDKLDNKDESKEKLEEKLKDKQERLEEKNQEIKEYLEEVKKEIEEELDNTSNPSPDLPLNKGRGQEDKIKEILKEAVQVSAMKLVSGVTEHNELEDGIVEGVADSYFEKKDALKTLEKSLESKDGENFNILIRTKLNKTNLDKTIKRFDESVESSFMYLDDISNLNYYELIIAKDSNFSKEILELESGNIPESFLNIEIIKPEVFGIEEIDNKPISNPSPALPLNKGREQKNRKFLNNENLDKTWGVSKYDTKIYLPKLKEYLDKKEKNSKSGKDNVSKNAKNNKNYKKIKVGIIDTGIDYNHTDLNGKVRKDLGYDFVNNDNDALDDQGHGTHVAGIISANLDGKGIVGVNPYVELVPLKICNKRGYCPSYAIIKALNYSVKNNLDVINMSLGGRGNTSTNPICIAISKADKSGVIIISAAGNSNIDTKNFIPGGCDGVISVSAVDENLKRAGFSNYGDTVDVSAPGVGIYSLSLNNSYKSMSGTSMSAPHVTGLVSIMLSINPDLSRYEIESILKKESNLEKTNYSGNSKIPGFVLADKVVLGMISDKNTPSTSGRGLVGGLKGEGKEGG